MKKILLGLVLLLLLLVVGCQPTQRQHGQAVSYDALSLSDFPDAFMWDIVIGDNAPQEDTIAATDLANNFQLSSDNCPNKYNPDQLDSNNDGVGDACENTKMNCVDTDGGFEKSVYGEVTRNGKTYKDSCSNSSSLIEVGCTKTIYKGEFFHLENTRLKYTGSGNCTNLNRKANFKLDDETNIERPVVNGTMNISIEGVEYQFTMSSCDSDSNLNYNYSLPVESEYDCICSEGKCSTTGPVCETVVCGDGECNQINDPECGIIPETAESCPQDCAQICPNLAVVCGDGECNQMNYSKCGIYPETAESCPQDCAQACTDTDGLNKHTVGTTTWNEFTGSDECITGGVMEYYCENDTIKSKLIPCDLNEQCVEGKCINNGISVRLYPGMNDFSIPVQPSNTSIAEVLKSIDGKYSTVTSWEANGARVYDPKYVSFSDLKTIEAGKGYEININSDTPVILTVYGTPQENSVVNLHEGYNLVGVPFMRNIDINSLNFTKGYEYIKYRMPASDDELSYPEFNDFEPGKAYLIYVPKTNTSNGVTGAVVFSDDDGDNVPVYNSTTILASQTYLNNNLILIGDACTNPLIAKLIQPDKCDFGLKQGEGFVKLIKENGYAYLIIAGYSGVEREQVVSALKDADHWKNVGVLRGDYLETTITPNGVDVSKPICGDGRCGLDDCAKDCNLQKNICTDSDGSNEYIRGITNKGDVVKSDRCIILNNQEYVTEYSCVDNDFSSTNVLCENGCQYGACIFYLELENIGDTIYNNKIKLPNDKIVNPWGTADYDQTAYFEDLYGNIKEINQYNVDTLDTNDVLEKVDIDFNENLKSEIITDTLSDIENEPINILGKEYNIVKANVFENNVKLYLMSGSVKSSLNKGNGKTYTIKGKDYDVTLDSISRVDSKDVVKLKVNGELTKDLAVGDIYKLSNGMFVGISYITNQQYEGGIHAVEFFMDAERVGLVNGADMTVNDVNTENKVVIYSDIVDKKLEINGISIKCESEACLQEKFCTDSDNGIDYFTKGKTQDYYDKTPDQDYCTRDGVEVYSCTNKSLNCGIVEEYCTNYFRRSGRVLTGEEFNKICPNGCQDGACIGKENVTIENISLPQGELWTDKTYWINYTLSKEVEHDFYLYKDGDLKGIYEGRTCKDCKYDFSVSRLGNYSVVIVIDGYAYEYKLNNFKKTTYEDILFEENIGSFKFIYSEGDANDYYANYYNYSTGNYGDVSIKTNTYDQKISIIKSYNEGNLTGEIKGDVYEINSNSFKDYVVWTSKDKIISISGKNITELIKKYKERYPSDVKNVKDDGICDIGEELETKDCSMEKCSTNYCKFNFATITNKYENCDKIKDDIYLSNCYAEVASNKNEPEVCSGLKYYSDSCYLDLATTHNLAQYCQYGYDSKWCYESIAREGIDPNSCDLINNTIEKATCLEYAQSCGNNVCDDWENRDSCAKDCIRLDENIENVEGYFVSNVDYYSYENEEDVDITYNDEIHVSIEKMFDQKELNEMINKLKDGNVQIEIKYGDRVIQIEGGYVWVSNNFVIFVENKSEKILKTYLEKYPSDIGEYRYTIYLNEGWNFISVPLVVKENLETFFGDAVETVYYFNGQWQVFNNNDKPDSLKSLEPGRGYWVYAKRDSKIDVKGTLGVVSSTGIESIPDFKLNKGWNLLGIHSIEKVKLGEYLKNIEGKYASIWYYDDNLKRVEKLEITNQSILYPGKGYWIYMNEEGVIVP